MMQKHILKLLLPMTLLLCAFTMNAAALSASGSAGENAEYRFADGVLTVSPVKKDSPASCERGAFLNCSGITKLILDEGIADIGDRAFQDCEDLTEIVFPESFPTIGTHAFSGCKTIKVLVFRGETPELPFGTFDQLGDPPAMIYTKDGKPFTIRGSYSIKLTFKPLSAYSGSVLSDGDIRIVAAIAALGICAFAVIFLTKKKKTAVKTR